MGTDTREPLLSADEKQPANAFDGIPPPVATAATRPKKSRFRKFLVHAVVLSLGLITAHRSFCVINSEVEAEAERFLANPYSLFERHHGHHPKGHKILNGKLAEKLFL